MLGNLYFWELGTRWAAPSPLCRIGKVNLLTPQWFHHVRLWGTEALKEHLVWSRRRPRQCRNTFYALVAQMQPTRPLWWVLSACRLFVAGGEWSYGVWRVVTCCPSPHSHTLSLSSPGWSELFILLSTSAASREMLSLGHYKYPRAVENVLTDAGDKREPACTVWLRLFDVVPSDLHFLSSDVSDWIWWKQGPLIRPPRSYSLQ